MDNTEITVSREEIRYLKMCLRRAGRKSYAKMVQVAHQKAIEQFLDLIPGSKQLLKISRILGWLYPILIFALPSAVFLITPWWAGFGLIAALLFTLNLIHTEITLELGARFIAFNRRTKIFER
jgi:hypothetical protein